MVTIPSLANQALIAAGPPAPMGGGMGGPPMGGPPTQPGQGGPSPQVTQAAQAIMSIQDPAELAVIMQLVQQKGEELMGGQQGAPQGPGGPPMGGPPPGPGAMPPGGPPMGM